MPRESFDIVEHVVDTVDAQTSKMQPDRVPENKIVLILADHGRHEPADVRAALDEAVTQGRLERDEKDVWIPAESSA